MAKVALALLAISAICINSCEAHSFLAQAPVKNITKRDIEDVLNAEMRGSVNDARFKDIEGELASMYAALPKDNRGLLDQATARYALNRYFIRKHAWVIKGLNGVVDASETEFESSLSKSAAVGYVQKLLGKEVGLRGLIVLAATLTDLVQNEAIGTLSSVFSGLDLPLSGPVPLEASEFAIKSYMIALLMGSSVSGAKSKKDFQLLERDVQRAYPSWQESVTFASDLRLTDDLARRSRRNPFIQRAVSSFDDASDFVQMFGQKFGLFQNLDCRQIKSKLMDWESEGSGRVPLAKFYNDISVGKDFKFAESVKYLRELGSLDETNPRQPSVVIPNYITGASNCLSTASFYSVCCTNECESLFGKIERAAGAQTSTPGQIAQMVANMASDTVDAPRNLSSTLMSRLNDISAYHRGQIPVHGRLFAQWMHHAYPRECPFPQLAGSTNPLTPEEWASTRSEAYLVTKEEANILTKAEVVEVGDLPWTNVEERIVGQVHAPASKGCARVVMASAALLSLAATMFRATKSTLGASDKASIGKEGCCEKSFV